jgi:hypothetical protein
MVNRMGRGLRPMLAALALTGCDVRLPGEGQTTVAGPAAVGTSDAQIASRSDLLQNPRGVGAVGSSDRLPSAEATGSGAERAFVTEILTDLQYRSFQTNTEYCGYIGLDPAGNLISTEVRMGTEASCRLPQVPDGMTLLASFHTHGTYSPYYASEFPTTTDMQSDAAEQIDGYISTPGGRLWYVDTDTMTVRQLCGRGCLPQDPGYNPNDDGPVRDMFTYQDLARFEAG